MKFFRNNMKHLPIFSENPNKASHSARHQEICVATVERGVLPKEGLMKLFSVTYFTYR